jgi:hypothetical protein
MGSADVARLSGPRLPGYGFLNGTIVACPESRNAIYHLRFALNIRVGLRTPQAFGVKPARGPEISCELYGLLDWPVKISR